MAWTAKPADVEEQLSSVRDIWGGDVVDVTQSLAQSAAVVGDGVAAGAGAAAEGAAEIDAAGGPVAWVVGLLVLVLILGGPWILRGIGAILGLLPVVGGWAKSHIDKAADWWQRTLYGWLGSVLNPVFHLARSVWLTLYGWVHVPAQIISALVAWVPQIVDVLIPTARVAAEQYAANLHSQSEAGISAAQQQATSQVAQAEAQAAAQDQQLAQQLQATTQSLQNDVQVSLGDAEAFTSQQVAQEAQARQAAISHAEQLGQTYTDLQVGQAELAGQEALQNAEQELAQQISAVAAAAGLALGAAVSTLTGEITSVGTEAETALEKLATQFKTVVDTCVDPMCQTQGNDANQLLNLLQIGGLAAMFAFLALAVKEPVGTANDTVLVVTPIIEAGGALLDGLLGLAE